MSVVLNEMMSQMIRHRLQQDRRTAGATVDVMCRDGQICIAGHVDSEEQKQAAVFLVEGIAGVNDVLVEIVVRQRFSKGF